MARSSRHDWFSFRRAFSRRPELQRPSKRQPFRRRLRVEPLEDRRLLAVVTVTTLNDTVDINDGVTSLREAIFATNLVGGADTIEFAASLTSAEAATFTLTQGELAITDALAISGPGANLVTIDASGNDPTSTENNGDGSRVFNIDDGNNANVLDISISGIALVGGDVLGNGGAIFSLENLTIAQSTISGNSTSVAIGNYYNQRGGGGIYIRDGKLTVTGSAISGNSANGYGSRGGAIHSRNSNLTMASSTINGNSAGTDGGGVFLIGGNATITGSTISGNSAGRLAGVPGGAAVGGGIFSYQGTLMVTDSTISGNSARHDGGGIWHAGDTLRITRSTISNNTAYDGGGIITGFFPPGSTLIVTDSTISGNSAARTGGGISNEGRTIATVIGSLIHGNSAAYGGGITNVSSGGLTVINSTISGNSAKTSPQFIDSRGGGILSFGSGGNLTVTNSTISGNSAGTDGGGIWTDSRVHAQPLPNVALVANSTISGNTANRGGGIFNDDGLTVIRFSSITANAAPDGMGSGVASNGYTFMNNYNTISARTEVHSSIIAGNANSDVDFVNGATNPFQSSRSNLIGNGNAVANFNQPGDQTGVVDPLLGPLADNGGPTFTHALLAGSPAINVGDRGAVAGAGGVPEFDQRGTPFGRVFWGRIDIGAFEYQLASDLNLVVDTLADESDGNYSLGDLSLREALLLANTYPSVDTIQFSPALTAGGPATILLTIGELLITDSTTMEGPGANLLTLRAFDPTPGTKNGDGRRILNIDDGNSATMIDVSISGLKLTGGDIGNSGNGGGIRNMETLTVTDSAITGNATSDAPFVSYDSGGGGIYNAGHLTVVRSTFTNNSTGRDGGAIRSVGAGSVVVVTDSTISGNSAGSHFSGEGGGIAVRAGGSLAVSGSTISDNTSNSVGGGISLQYGGTVTVTDSTISGNSAQNAGGGIQSNRGNVTVTKTTVSGNSAVNGSGGIGTSYGSLTVVDCTVSNNSAGGILSSRGILTVSGSTISGNSGGGVGFLYGSGTITDSMISGNSALGMYSRGGGLFTHGGPMTLTRTTVSGNTATIGGGISSGSFPVSTPGTLTIIDSTVSGNSAVDGPGGGIYHGGFSGNLTIAGSTVSGNTTNEQGGGLYLKAFYNPGTFTIRHSTIAANSAYGQFRGGGIFVHSGALVLDHTIVATNDTGTSFGRDLIGFLGTTIDARYSLIGTNGGSGLPEAPVGSPDAKGNLIGGPNQFINPLLVPLGDNGGLTKTHALAASSPARNAGDPSAVGGVGTVPQFDQRGGPYVRVFGGRIDIGAYERQTGQIPSLVVDTLADEVDGDYSPGDFSLREAIGLANGNVDSPATITFATAFTAGGAATIHLTRGELGISDSLTIVGPGADLLTIDASASDPTPNQNNFDGSGVFRVDDGNFETDSTASIFGLTLTGGDTTFYGGGIFSAESLIISNSTIRGNSGGGIYSLGTLTTITGSTIRDNMGSGISSYSANLNVADSTISGNSGRGIRGGGGIVTVTRSTVSGNSGVQGGGIYAPGMLTVTASTISGNSAQHGGGIMTRGPLTVTDSTISGNSATYGNGGGIFSAGYGQTTITNSTISGNFATAFGGGIHFASSPSLTVSHSTITGNRANSNGGGLSNSGYGSAVLDHTIVAGNTRGPTTRSDVFGGATLAFSLLGVNTGATIGDIGGNLIGTTTEPISPMLGPLANNGGPTLPDGSKMLTHALLSGSPAINAGNPSAVAGIGGVPQFDQRGGPSSRVSGGQIDIGALESQVLPPATFGDYNNDGVVNTADYNVWEDTFGSTTDLRADGNGNGTIDAADYVLWKSNFGLTFTGVAIIPASVTVAAGATTQLTAAVVDQFGNPLSAQPAFTWSVASGAGSVDGSGLYSAALSAGSATVHAASASGSTDANITIVAPLAWYKTDASTGTELTDSSGNGKTGALTGSAGWAAGVSGNALSLTGGSASLPAGIVNGLNDFTVATWLRINTLGTWSRVFDFGTGTAVNMFLTPRANGAGGPLRFGITTSGSGGEQQLDGPTLSAGTWYHLAITLAGNTGTMYVNGEAVATNTNMTIHPAALGNTAQNYLGDSQYGADPNLRGRIDDFRIYGTALTAQQVLQLASPIVVTPAVAAANPVTAMSTSLSVLAADITAGEPALSYTWSTTGSPPAPVMFSANGTNAAKNTTVTFTQVGIYNFQVTVVNPVAGLSTNSSTSVTVMLPGDYNFNGIVDTADYTVWEDTFGSTTDPRADGNGDGVVNTPDYDLWKANFGQTLPPPSAGSGAAVETFSEAAIQAREPIAHLPTVTPSPPAGTSIAAVRVASFASVETRSSWPASGSRSRVHLSRHRGEESSGDELLLLALDQVGLFRRQTLPATADRESHEPNVGYADRLHFVEEPLSIAFAEWQ